MTFRIRISNEARQQLLAIDTWWTANRRDAPELVWNELDEAIAALRRFPTVGRFYPPIPDHRRVLLRRSRFHVYYVVDEAKREVIVVAVWGGQRGHGPSSE